MKEYSVKQAAAIIAERSGYPLSPRQLRHEIQLGRCNAKRLGDSLHYILTDKDIANYKRRKTGKPPKSK